MVFPITSRIKVEIDAWLTSTPYEKFYKEISKEIIGQEELGLVLANVYNYLENLNRGNPINNNMILAAPSGTGKTETYRALAKYFKKAIPEFKIYMLDVSQLTASGYKGSEPYEILSPFFEAKVHDAVGICFLDELDKKLVPSFNNSGQNVNIEAQSNLLTIVEGSEVRNNKGITVDSSNIMFVGLGSFDEFRKTRADEASNSLGFISASDAEKVEKTTECFAPLTREDMFEFGGTNELLGRFPIIVNYNKLSKEAVNEIIDKTAKSISQAYCCDIKLDDEFVEELHAAANSKYGCRIFDSMIREEVLRAYNKSLLSPKEKDVLKIIIHSKGKTTFKYRVYTKSELKKLDKFLLEEEPLLEGLEQELDNLQEIARSLDGENYEEKIEIRIGERLYRKMMNLCLNDRLTNITICSLMNILEGVSDASEQSDVERRILTVLGSNEDPEVIEHRMIRLSKSLGGRS